MPKKLLLLLIIAFSGIVFAQNVTMVEPGDGSLTTAIENASSGDILVLSNGAEYTTSTANFAVLKNKKITIKAEEPTAEVKPILYSNFTPGENSPSEYFVLDEGSSLTLEGLEIRGDSPMTPGTPVQTKLISYPIPLNEIQVGKLYIKDCVIHDFLGNMVDGAFDATLYNVVQDTIMLHNTIVYNLGDEPGSGTTGSIVQFKYANCKYFEAKNCTFYHINAYGLRFEGGSSYSNTFPPIGVVDHCTFNDIGGGKNMILVEHSDNEWTITNSIFSNAQDKGEKVLYFKRASSDMPPIATWKKLCFWELGPNRDLRWVTIPSENDTIYMDPEYLDPANGNFTLPAGSPLLTFGTDGGPIGDLRWAGNAVSVEENEILPTSFNLEQNYPNPFNPTTNISFTIPQAGYAKLVIYDVLGREVAVLIDGQLNAGNHNFVFNATDLSTGIYLYKLTTNEKSLVRKMMLIK